MKFITTKELGRLCKWLRIMGFDAAYFPDAERRELIIKSLQDDRIILSRDSKMSVYSGVRMLHIKSDFVEDQVKQVVVGLPRSMNGSIGQQAQKVQAFIQGLSNRTQLPIEFRDERLTTVAAKRLMRAARTKKPRNKTRDDAVAAALILQGYLDEGNNKELPLPPEPEP